MFSYFLIHQFTLWWELWTDQNVSGFLSLMIMTLFVSLLSCLSIFSNGPATWSGSLLINHHVLFIDDVWLFKKRLITTIFIQKILLFGIRYFSRYFLPICYTLNLLNFKDTFIIDLYFLFWNLILVFLFGLTLYFFLLWLLFLIGIFTFTFTFTVSMDTW